MNSPAPRWAGSRKEVLSNGLGTRPVRRPVAAGEFPIRHPFSGMRRFPYNRIGSRTLLYLWGDSVALLGRQKPPGSLFGNGCRFDRRAQRLFVVDPKTGDLPGHEMAGAEGGVSPSHPGPWARNSPRRAARRFKDREADKEYEPFDDRPD